MKPQNSKAVLLDLGNVLVGADHERAVTAFGRQTGRSAESIRSAFGEDNLHTDFNLGLIHASEFRRQALARLGIALGDRKFDAAWCATVMPLAHIDPLLEELARHHALYLLSNTDPIHFAWVETQCTWLRLFTGKHLSYEVGLAKPDLEYYTTALGRFHLDPENCVFFDDLLTNVEGAESAGIESRQVGTGGLTGTDLVTCGIQLRRH